MKNAVAELTADERYEQNRTWICAAQSGDEAALESLVVHNTALVRSIAVRFRDRGTDMEDLMQIGMIGLIKAVRSFDFSRNTAFSTYAVPLITGEIRRHLRDDGLIRVSRSYKQIGVALLRERNRIRMQQGREPGIAELAALCNVTPEEAAIALDATSPVTSLSETVCGEDSPTYENSLPDRDAADEMEALTDRVALSQALSRMPEQWQKIVLLRYFRDQTQDETARQLGLSQVKVSREEKKIMAFLRAQLTASG